MVELRVDDFVVDEEGRRRIDEEQLRIEAARKKRDEAMLLELERRDQGGDPTLLSPDASGCFARLVHRNSFCVHHLGMDGLEQTASEEHMRHLKHNHTSQPEPQVVQLDSAGNFAEIASPDYGEESSEPPSAIKDSCDQFACSASSRASS